ncbi:MAG: hypothetical protein ACE5FI_09150 [Anaerolineales bacterium]
MIQRQAQSAEYWGENFSLEPSDLEHLNNLLLEAEMPLATDDMALAVLRYRVAAEEARIERKLLNGAAVYLPRDTYEVGQELVFPALEYAHGHITAVREGHNPEQGAFQVISVDLDDGGSREFAANLPQHVLNEQGGVLVAEDEALPRSPEELFEKFGALLKPRLEADLRASSDIVSIAGQWFPRALIAEINEGHLNLAEAVLDVNGGGPLPTEELVRHIDLAANIEHRLQVFSLNYALQEDERFDEVGPSGQVLWYLRRLEPPEVLFPPPRLKYEAVPYEKAILTPELIALARSIDDELDDLQSDEPAVVADATSVQLILTFPHVRVGSLPLTSQLAPLFPTAYEAPRVRFELVDGHTGEQLPGWVVLNERYVFGLGPWYEKYKVVAGCFLTVSRGQTPGQVTITIDKRRSVSEWVRTATVSGNRIDFAMRKQPIQVNYSEEMMVSIEDASVVDEAWLSMTQNEMPLARLVVDSFRELAKLTPQGTVHAKALYSGVNVWRRVPPGPVFAELVRQPYYEHVGDAYWRFEPSRYNQD